MSDLSINPFINGSNPYFQGVNPYAQTVKPAEEKEGNPFAAGMAGVWGAQSQQVAGIDASFYESVKKVTQKAPVQHVDPKVVNRFAQQYGTSNIDVASTKYTGVSAMPTGVALKDMAIYNGKIAQDGTPGRNGTECNLIG